MVNKRRSSRSPPPVRKRNKHLDDIDLGSRIESFCQPAEISCIQCFTEQTVCFVADISIRCSRCCFKNRTCSMGPDREYAKRVSAHALLNERISEAERKHSQAALVVSQSMTEFSQLTLDLLRLRQQRESLSSSGLRVANQILGIDRWVSVF